MEQYLSPVNTETQRLLCSRRKNVDIFLLPLTRQLHVAAEMEDSVHHMRIDMIVKQTSLRITAITCDMTSVPDPICRQARNCFNDLIGQCCITPGLTRGIRQKAPAGCTHLANLFHDACYNIIMAQGVVTKETLNTHYPDISEAQVYNIFMMFRPELRNSCIRYADKSPFMKIVNSASLPEGFRKSLKQTSSKHSTTATLS